MTDYNNLKNNDLDDDSKLLNNTLNNLNAQYSNSKNPEDDTQQELDFGNNNKTNPVFTSSKNIHDEKIQQFRNVSEYGKYVFLAMIIGIILSIAIAGLGGALLARSAKSLSYLLIIFGVISALAFAFGIFAVNQYSERCDDFFINEKDMDPELIDQSIERTYLNVALYLMMILLLIFALLSVSCLVFNEEIKYGIKGIAQNSTKWQKYFGNLTYDSVMNSAKSIMIAIGVFGLTLVLLISTLLYFAYKMLGGYRTWQTIVQFICLIFLKFGFVFLYLSIYAQRYRDVAKVDKAMPSWVPEALMAASIIAILIAIFGYIAAWTENKIFLHIFIIITGIFTMSIIVFAIGSALFAGKFKDYFQNRCTSILDYVNKDYLVNYMGCEKKYVFTSNTLNNMKCPKERIVTDWESNLYTELKFQKESYGCIDMECCYTTYSFIKGKVDYAALFAFSMFLFGCIMVGGSWYMLTQIELNIERGLTTKKAQYFIYGLIIAVIIILIVFITLIPTPPIPSPIINTPVNPADKNNTKVDPQIVINTIVNKTDVVQKKENDDIIKNQTIVTEDKTKCEGNCLKLKYYFELSSNDGVFKPNNGKLSGLSNIKIIKNEKLNLNNMNGWIVAFNGNSSDLNSFMDYFTFNLNCPLNPAKIHVKITATAFNPNLTSITPTANSFLQKNMLIKKANLKLKQVNATVPESTTLNNTTTTNSSISGFNNNTGVNNLNTPIYNSINSSIPIIDYTKLIENQTYSIIDKDLDYSFVDPTNFQIVSGSVVKVLTLNSTKPIANATVSLSSLTYPSCPSITLLTDGNGIFVSNKLNILKNNDPTQYRLDLSSSGLMNVQKMITTGGLGATEFIKLGIIKMWDPALMAKTSISTVVINSINNQKLENVNVTLYAGYKIVNNEVVAVQNEDAQKADESLVATFIQSSLSEKSLQNSTSDSNSSSVLISTTISDLSGKFNFDNLDPNTYTLIFEKDNFYTEVYYIEIMGNNTKPLLTIGMTPLVDAGQLRFVLSWPFGPKDLDLHSFFSISRFSKCEVYFGQRDCVGTTLDTDNFNGGASGVETITINLLGNYIYTFAVNKYVDVTTGNGQAQGDTPVSGQEESNSTAVEAAINIGIPDTTLAQSTAKISVYSYGYKGPIFSLTVPTFMPENLIVNTQNESGINDEKSYNWWLAFCLNGSTGFNSLTPVNKLSTDIPSYNYCGQYF